MMRTLNDIRTGRAALFNDPFRGEKLVADGPVEIRPIPEYPVWMEQPAPGYDADSWLFRSSGPTNPRTVAVMVIGLLALAFIGMGLT